MPLGLPLELTTFVGRAREQAEVARLLETTRLSALVGTGGVGKTRLALPVADHFADGVWLVEQASLADRHSCRSAGFAAANQ